MKKKMLSLILSSTMIMTLIVGCGSEQTAVSSETKDTTSESQVVEETEESSEEVIAEEKKDVTITMLLSESATAPIQEGLILWDWIKEKTGVTIEYTSIPSSDYESKKSLVYNSGEIPDLVTKTSVKAADVTAGILLPISDYVDQMPNFTAFLEEYGYTQDMENTRFSDGNYYGFPQKVREEILKVQQWMIRSDVFEENNIPIPTTMDEIYEAGVMLKEIYPDSTPITNRFGVGNIMGAIGAGFGTLAGNALTDGTIYNVEDDEWYFAPITDEWKEMITWTNKCIESGVLDKEFTTLDSVTYEQRIVSGETFILYDWSSNAGRYITAGLELDEDFNVAMIYPPTGPNGDYALPPENFWSGGMAVLPASLADDEEHLADVLAFIDWCYTDEAAVITTFGVEGETFVMGDDGRMERIAEGGSEQSRTLYGVCMDGPTFRQHIDSAFDNFTEEIAEMQIQVTADNVLPAKNPQTPISMDELEEIQMYTTPLMDYAKATMEKMIFGEISLDEWDSFVAECDAKGAQKIIDATNVAWDAR